MKRRTALAILIVTALLLNPLAGCGWPWDGEATPSPTGRPAGSPTPVSVGQATKIPATQTTADPTFTPGPEGSVDGYIAVAPRILRSGQSETVSVSLFSGRQWSNGNVQLVLLKDGQPLAETRAFIRGRGDLRLRVPRLDEGDYQLQLIGRSFQAQSPIRVEDGTLIFLETDKPIYKPGQTIHIRALTLDPELKPLAGDVSLEVMDAKGLKVFKSEVTTDDYGMASVELPLSSEPNLGVWKLTTKSGKRTAQLDVRVERYVLPKYEIGVSIAKDWVLASEPIRGKVSAEYSYGKPVRGEVEIKALRYVGNWEEYASVTREVDGQVDFELPAVQYVSGVPGAEGMGNVTLEITVRERATGYEEKTTRMLSVAASPVLIKLIPESTSFKPSLPLSIMVIAQTPDNKPVDATVWVDISFGDREWELTNETHQVSIKQGKAILKVTPPREAIMMGVYAYTEGASTSLAMQSGYSPTGSFIHLEQTGQGDLKVGDTARFRVTSTKEASNFYYEVVARGKVVFSSFSRTPDIEFTVSPLMAPSARLLVYQILPNSEVAADYLPFAAVGSYPQSVRVDLGAAEVRPGEDVPVMLQTEGPSKVGLAAVDRSVFILAENRLNLQQVFDELERLYRQPQAELHEVNWFSSIPTMGAREVFEEAGVIVLSNKTVPEGEEIENPYAGEMVAAVPEAAAGAEVRKLAEAPVEPTATQSTADNATGTGGLAEVKRVRQFFPETWIWDSFLTDASGRASKTYTAPDSITTWMLRAVALSKEHGLGISEAQLRVLQPFFVQPDLPYSVVRGEEFPIRVSLYNYTDRDEDFTVQLERADWFTLVGEDTRTVRVGANDLGSVSFTIRPSQLGTQQVKVTARSRSEADAIVRDLIVEPEGVAREEVENYVISAGSTSEMDMSLPRGIIEGSDRGYVALTGSFLTQTIEGLEKLLQMPFGCGEQNMILFAPNVFVSRYLKETGQMKPEVMAKAEHLMITGYQRQLTYRHRDGSFSAFGEQDAEGSLWLTAFVLKSFAQAKDIVYIDQTVLESAREWIAKHQNADGSFDPVGFLHHTELLGGLSGKTALTAYVTIALKEAGDNAAAAKGAAYLEKALDASEDPYSVAITAYALELTKSPRANAAYEKLMSLARESDGGLFWGSDQPRPEPIVPLRAERDLILPPEGNRSAVIETTAYATLALIEHGDQMNASRAARWLVSQRNAFGGFDSTQDTVVGLQALTSFAAKSKADVDASVTLRSGDWQKELRISPTNADVLQLIEVPTRGMLTAEVKGKGQVVLQTVRRYHVPKPADAEVSVFQLEVTYGTAEIEVNDLITVQAAIRFTPPLPVNAGMTVFDVAIPTGFAPVAESLDVLVQSEPKLKRYEVAGRKVILYIEDMRPNERLEFRFQARALYPVKAQAVTSQAYSYYQPEFRGESLGGALEVKEAR